MKQVFRGSDGGKSGLAKDAVQSFALKVVHALLNLALSIVLARTMAPSGYGVYAFALSLMSLLAVPVQLGLPTLLMREVARYHQAADWGLLRGILRNANKAVLLLSAVVASVAAAVAWGFPRHWGTLQLVTFGWSLALLPLIALNRLREAALQGLRRVILGQVPEKLVQPVLFLLLVGGATLGGALTPPRAMALSCAATAASFAVGAVLLWRALPEEMGRVEARYDRPSWQRSFFPLSLLAGLNYLNGQTDLLMLGLLGTKQDVGLYRVAASGAGLVTFTLLAVNSVLGPRIVRIYAAGDREELQRIVVQSARATSRVALPVAALFVLLGGPILSLAYGPAYRGASVALAILSVAQLVNVTTGSVHLILNMTGHELETVRGAACSAVINVALNAALVPRFGLEGAAVATAISIVFVNVFLFRVVWRKTGIWSLAVGGSRAGRSGSPSRIDADSDQGD